MRGSRSGSRRGDAGLTHSGGVGSRTWSSGGRRGTSELVLRPSISRSNCPSWIRFQVELFGGGRVVRVAFWRDRDHEAQIALGPGFLLGDGAFALAPWTWCAMPAELEIWNCLFPVAQSTGFSGTRVDGEIDSFSFVGEFLPAGCRQFVKSCLYPVGVRASEAADDFLSGPVRSRLQSCSSRQTQQPPSSARGALGLCRESWPMPGVPMRALVEAVQRPSAAVDQLSPGAASHALLAGDSVRGRQPSRVLFRRAGPQLCASFWVGSGGSGAKRRHDLGTADSASIAAEADRCLVLVVRRSSFLCSAARRAR